MQSCAVRYLQRAANNLCSTQERPGSALPDRRKGVQGVQDVIQLVDHMPRLVEGKQHQAATQVLMMECWYHEVIFHAWEPCLTLRSTW